MTDPKGDWIGLSETARILGVHPSTVRTWADSGKIPVHRTAGGHRRFLRTEIENLRGGSADSGVKLVVENVIGRTRLEVAEGRLESQAWYRRLTEPQRQAYRDESHRLVQQVGELIGAESSEEARQIGHDYARISLEAGMSLVEAVEAFLFFREFLIESINSLHETRGGSSWTQFQRQASRFIDGVLVAIVATYQES